MRDDFAKRTVTELAKGVGYRCSNPECRRATVGANAEQDGAITIGAAAHICAASAGGPRYDPAQARDARRSKTNGIWLCQNCARLIDTDVRKFSVELLHEWKRRAQERAFRELVAQAADGPTEAAARVSSIIAVENAGDADPEFEAIFAGAHAAASTDLAAFKRLPVWSDETVELTLRTVDDHGAPPFTISLLPLAVEVAPEIAIVAPPGTGKTVTLLQLAGHTLDTGLSIPAYFRLGDWAAGALSLLSSLRQRPAFRDVTENHIRQLAERGRLLLLLDGWNEVDQATRKKLRIELSQLRRDYPDTRIVIATRRQMLDVPITGPHVAIEPLSEEQEIAIAHARLGAAGVKIVDDAWRTPGVRELIAIPLYLSALLAGSSSGTRPTTKEEVLRLFVQQHERVGEHAEALQAMLFGCHPAILEALACHLNATGGATTMKDGDARRIVTAENAQLREQGQLRGQPEPSAVLELLSAHHTLMRSGHDGGLAFQHQQFQEWYAGLKVVELVRESAVGSSTARDTLRVEILDQPAWEESVLFAIERVSREKAGVAAAAHAVRLALAIDPMLAAEMIYRAASAVWQIVQAEMIAFAQRWHHAGMVDRAVRFMIMTGRPEFESQIWPLASSTNTQIQLPTLRTAPRFRPSVIASSLRTKLAVLPEAAREHLLGSIASQSGVDGMDLATELAKTDSSPKVQAAVIESLLFRRAHRHAESLLAVAHDETWAFVARRDYADEIRDSAIAARLSAERTSALARAAQPGERLRLLLDVASENPDRNAGIVAAIADVDFPTTDPNAGSLLYFAYQRAPGTVLEGLRQRLEAGLELPFHTYDLLDQLPVTDEGTISAAILDVTRDDPRFNAVAVVAGPRTVTALVDKYLKCVQALKSDRNNRSLSDEFYRLRDRIGATRAPQFIAAILAHGETEDPSLIGALASLVSFHGRHDGGGGPVAVEPAVKPLMIDTVHRWVDCVISSADAARHHLSEVSSAIGRLRFLELTLDLKRLLDEELTRLKASDALLESQISRGIRTTVNVRMLYNNQYREAFSRIGSNEVAVIVADYLEDRVFGLEAALILQSISNGQINTPEPNPLRRWPWFDEVDAARARRATLPPSQPENELAVPIFAAIDRLTRSDTDRDGQLLAIGLTRIALGMPHTDQDALIARVMSLPQPVKTKRELLAAMVLDGQVIEVDVVMQGIDEWLAEAPQDAWNKRQNTWEIEPWLELLPFSTRPDAVIEGITKVKAFYGAGWAKHWERVLEAVAKLPGAEGDALLADLARLHTDIASEYEWTKAILSRDSPTAAFLCIDLFAEERLGRGPHGVDAWHAGRELAPFVERFPEARAELRKRYEAATGACRVLLEHLMEECGDEDDLMAMVKKYAASGQNYDGRMDGVVRAVALRHVPVQDGSNAFYIHPVPTTRIRKILFGLTDGTRPHQEAALAMRCLTAIDVLRDEHGVAGNDTRHPDVRSGAPWPPEAVAS